MRQDIYGQTLAYQISGFVVDVDQVLKYSAARVMDYYICMASFISRNNDQIFGKSWCTTVYSISNSRVENIKIAKSYA